MRTTTRATRATGGTAAAREWHAGGTTSSSNSGRGEVAELLRAMCSATADELENAASEAMRRAAQADLDGDHARRDAYLRAALAAAKIRRLTEVECERATTDDLIL